MIIGNVNRRIDINFALLRASISKTKKQSQEGPYYHWEASQYQTSSQSKDQVFLYLRVPFSTPIHCQLHSLTCWGPIVTWPLPNTSIIWPRDSACAMGKLVTSHKPVWSNSWGSQPQSRYAQHSWKSFLKTLTCQKKTLQFFYSPESQLLETHWGSSLTSRGYNPLEH